MNKLCRNSYSNSKLMPLTECYFYRWEDRMLLKIKLERVSKVIIRLILLNLACLVWISHSICHKVKECTILLLQRWWLPLTWLNLSLTLMFNRTNKCMVCLLSLLADSPYKLLSSSTRLQITTTITVKSLLVLKERNVNKQVIQFNSNLVIHRLLIT